MINHNLINGDNLNSCSSSEELLATEDRFKQTCLGYKQVISAEGFVAFLNGIHTPTQHDTPNHFVSRTYVRDIG